MLQLGLVANWITRMPIGFTKPIGLLFVIQLAYISVKKVFFDRLYRSRCMAHLFPGLGR